MGSEQLKGGEATPSRKKSKKMPFKPIEMPKCPKCGKSVYAAEEKLAGGHKWHTGCFKCSMCNKMLDSTNCNERDSALFCKVNHILSNCISSILSYAFLCLLLQMYVFFLLLLLAPPGDPSVPIPSIRPLISPWPYIHP